MLTKNERALLFLVSKFGIISRMKLVKLMFLASQEWNLYDFVPYRYGPFSFQLYRDLSHLEREGYVANNDHEVRFIDQIFPKPDFFLQDTIETYTAQFEHATDSMVIEYVYDRFPAYTIFSEIRHLQEYQRDETGIATIGYEGRSIDGFLSALIEHKTCTLIDVRKNAYSMKYGFSKIKLSEYLSNFQIRYEHMPELGIVSERRKNLTPDGYQKLFLQYARELPARNEALDEIRRLAGTERVVLMCFEKDARDCHRGVIAEMFRSEGLEVADL
jgi:uncharacterized protein (DUF488 family)